MQGSAAGLATRGIERSGLPDRAAEPGEPRIRRAKQAGDRYRTQCCASSILCFCLLAAVFAAQPGLAQTAPTSPAVASGAPTAQPSPAAPGALVSPLPVITPLTNPAVISPVPQLEVEANTGGGYFPAEGSRARPPLPWSRPPDRREHGGSDRRRDLPRRLPRAAQPRERNLPDPQNRRRLSPADNAAELGRP